MTGNQNGQDIKAYLLEKHRQGQISQTLCDAITALCDAAQKIAQIAAQNGIGAASLGALTGAENTDGDEQKALDVMADELIVPPSRRQELPPICQKSVMMRLSFLTQKSA